MKTDNMLQPSPSLLCKLASIVVHADEFLSEDTHHFDREALLQCINDAEVMEWIQKMTKAAMAPRKRNG